jgi:hypothetical protein
MMHMVALGLWVYTVVILHTLYFGSVATSMLLVKSDVSQLLEGRGGNIFGSYRESAKVDCITWINNHRSVTLGV